MKEEFGTKVRKILNCFQLNYKQKCCKWASLQEILLTNRQNNEKKPTQDL